MESRNSKTKPLKIKRIEKRMKEGSKCQWSITTSRRAQVVLDDGKFDTVATKEAKMPLKFDYIHYISLPIQVDTTNINQTAVITPRDDEDPVYRDWDEGPWIRKAQVQRIPSPSMVMETVLGNENIYDILLIDDLELSDQQYDGNYDEISPCNDNQIQTRSQCSSENVPESNESNQTSASQYEEMVNIFKPLIVENVQVRQVYTYLPFIENSETERFLSIERENPRRAMSELLEYIIRCHEIGKWKQLIQAFETCGEDILLVGAGARYQYIAQNIRGYRVIDSSYQKQYLKILSPKIKPMINVTDLLPRLCALDVLNDHDKEEIEREKCNNGSTVAAGLLLDRITRKHPLWYINFISALKEVGRDDIAADLDIPEMIDTDKKEKLHSNDTEENKSLQSSENDHKNTSDRPNLQAGLSYLHESKSFQWQETEPDLSHTRRHSMSNDIPAESNSQQLKYIHSLQGKEMKHSYVNELQEDTLYENVFQYEDAISKHVNTAAPGYQNTKGVVAVHGRDDIQPPGYRTYNKYDEEMTNESCIEDDTICGAMDTKRNKICQTEPYETTQSEEIPMQRASNEITKDPTHEGAFLKDAKTKKRNKHNYENQDIDEPTCEEITRKVKFTCRPRPPRPLPRTSICPPTQHKPVNPHDIEEHDIPIPCNYFGDKEAGNSANNDPVSDTEYNYDRVNDFAQKLSISNAGRACSKLEERLKNIRIQNNELNMEVVLLKEADSLQEQIVANLQEKRRLNKNISMKEKECQALISAIEEDEKQIETLDDVDESSGKTTWSGEYRLKSSPSKYTLDFGHERTHSSYGDITFNETHLQDVYSKIVPVKIYDISRNRTTRFSDNDSAFYSEYTY